MSMIGSAVKHNPTSTLHFTWVISP